MDSNLNVSLIDIHDLKETVNNSNKIFTDEVKLCESSLDNVINFCSKGNTTSALFYALQNKGLRDLQNIYLNDSFVDSTDISLSLKEKNIERKKFSPQIITALAYLLSIANSNTSNFIYMIQEVLKCGDSAIKYITQDMQTEISSFVCDNFIYVFAAPNSALLGCYFKKALKTLLNYSAYTLLSKSSKADVFSDYNFHKISKSIALLKNNNENQKGSSGYIDDPNHSKEVYSFSIDQSTELSKSNDNETSNNQIARVNNIVNNNGINTKQTYIDVNLSVYEPGFSQNETITFFRPFIEKMNLYKAKLYFYLRRKCKEIKDTGNSPKIVLVSHSMTTPFLASICCDLTKHNEIIDSPQKNLFLYSFNSPKCLYGCFKNSFENFKKLIPNSIEIHSENDIISKFPFNSITNCYTEDSLLMYASNYVMVLRSHLQIEFQSQYLQKYKTMHQHDEARNETSDELIKFILNYFGFRPKQFIQTEILLNEARKNILFQVNKKNPNNNCKKISFMMKTLFTPKSGIYFLFNRKNLLNALKVENMTLFCYIKTCQYTGTQAYLHNRKIRYDNKLLPKTQLCVIGPVYQDTKTALYELSAAEIIDANNLTNDEKLMAIGWRHEDLQNGEESERSFISKNDTEF